VVRAVEHVRYAMGVAEAVIDLQTVLVRLLDRASAFRHVIVVDVAERARHEPGSIRADALRPQERKVLLGHRAEPLDGNFVAGKRVADESGSVWIRTSRRRVIDRQQLSVGTDPVREIAVQHLWCWNASE